MHFNCGEERRGELIHCCRTSDQISSHIHQTLISSPGLNEAEKESSFDLFSLACAIICCGFSCANIFFLPSSPLISAGKCSLDAVGKEGRVEEEEAM